MQGLTASMKNSDFILNVMEDFKRGVASHVLCQRSTLPAVQQVIGEG